MQIFLARKSGKDRTLHNYQFRLWLYMLINGHISTRWLLLVSTQQSGKILFEIYF